MNELTGDVSSRVGSSSKRRSSPRAKEPGPTSSSTMPQDYSVDEDEVAAAAAAAQNGHKSLDTAAERAVKQLEESYQDGSHDGSRRRGTGGERELFTGKFDSRKAHLLSLHNEDEYSVSGGSCSSSTTAHSGNSSSDELVEGLFTGETLPPGGYDELVQGQEAYYDDDDNEDGDMSSANASEGTDGSFEDKTSSGRNSDPSPLPDKKQASNHQDRRAKPGPTADDSKTRSQKSLSKSGQSAGRKNEKRDNDKGKNKKGAAVVAGTAAVAGGTAAGYAMANNNKNGSSEPAGNDGRTMSVKPNDDPTYVKEARYGSANSGGEPDHVVDNVPIDRKPDADNDEGNAGLLPDAELVGEHKFDDENRTGITSRDGNKDLEADDKDLEVNDDENDGNNDDAKTQEELEEELEEERRRRRRRRCIWLLLCLFCCLLILLISLISYWVTRDEEMAPTMAPTQAPNTVVGSWVQKFPALPGPAGAMFGAAVGLDANYMTAGSPLFEQRGTVFTAVYDEFGEGDWIIKPSLFGEQVGDRFGAALDLVGQRMVVGAPNKLMEGSETQSGAAYYYEFDETIQAWSQVGPVIRGDMDVLAGGGEFGAAVSVGVSVDLIPRIVVGAPKHNADVDRPTVGRVYAFEGKAGGTNATNDISGGSANATNSTAYWTSLKGESFLGEESGDLFGSAIDMSDDGTRFIVGAPGDGSKKGYARIYEWDGSAWRLDFQVEGAAENEQFGASVTSLTETVFAIGAPGFNNFAGQVVIYERKAQGNYERIGEIVGEFGDLIGKPYSISGGLHDDGFNPEQFTGDEVLMIIIAKATGGIISFGYDENRNLWVERVEELATGMEDLVVSYSLQNGLMWGAPIADQFSALEFSHCDPADNETGATCAYGCDPEEEWCAYQRDDGEDEIADSSGVTTSKQWFNFTTAAAVALLSLLYLA